MIKEAINRYGEKNLSGSCFSFERVKALAVPVFLEQVSTTAIILLNGILISSSSQEAFAAVSVVDVLNLFMMNIFIALASGGTVVVAQYMGRGDMDKVQNSVVQSMKITTMVASLIGLFIVVFHKQFIYLLYKDLEPAVMENVILYVFGSCLSYPLSGFYNSSVAVLRGAGKTKVSSKIIVMTSIANVTVTTIFVKVLHLYIWGVMAGLLTARLLGTYLCYLAITNAFPNVIPDFKRYFKKNKGIKSSIFFIGIPAAIEQLFFNGGKLVTQAFVVAMGTQMISAHTITDQFYSLIFIPTVTLNLCIVTIVGTCLGAGEKEEAKRFTKNLIKTTAIVNILVSIFALPVLGPVVKLYTKVPEIQDTVIRIIPLVMLANIVFLGLSYIQPSALRAAGDVRFVTVTSLITTWTIRITLGYYFGIVLGMKVYGIWIAMVCEWVVKAVIYSLRNKSNKWLEFKFLN